MAKMRVMVVKYGYAVVEVDTESEAIDLAHDMDDEDFDWSDFDEAQVVDDDVDFEWWNQDFKNVEENLAKSSLKTCIVYGKGK